MRKFFLLFTALLLSVVSASAAKKFVQLTSDNINQVTTGTRCIFAGTMPDNYSVEAVRGKSYVLTSKASSNSANYLAGEEIQLNADGSLTPTANTLITSVNISGAAWEFFQWTEDGVSSKGLASAGNNRLTLGATPSKWTVTANATGASVIIFGGTGPIQCGCNTTAPYESFFLRTSATLANQGVYRAPELYVEIEVADAPVVGTKDNPYVVSTLGEITEADKYYAYNGSALVTCRDYSNATYFVQDTSAAIKMTGDASIQNFYSSFFVGDKVTNLLLYCKGNNECMLTTTDGVDYEEGNAVEPQVVTLQELATNPALKYRFVKVDQVSSADAGQVFALASTFSLTQESYTAPGILGCFGPEDSAKDVIGHTVPQYMNVAGILDGTVLRPREWSDITELEAPVTENGTPEHPFTITSLAEITNDAFYYLFKGEAVVTFVDNNSGNIYITSTEGARQVYVGVPQAKLMSIGDQVTNMLVKPPYKGVSRNQLTLEENTTATDGMLNITAKNVAVEPKVVTLSDSWSRYDLVKVENVTFVNPNNDTFGIANFGLKQGDVTKDNVVNIFGGSDLNNTAVPTVPCNVTGIVFSAEMIYLRDKADIEVLPVVKPTFTFYKKMPNGNYNKWSSSYTGLNGVNTRVANVYLEVINPTGDLTIECPEYVTPDKTTISKADLEAGICQIDFTIAPENAGAFEASVTLKMEDADDVTLTLSGNISMVKEVTSLADVFEQNGVFFNVKDTEVTVSYVEKVDEYDTFAYVQNEESAMRLAINSYNAPTGDKELKAGVTFKNFWVLPKKAADGSWLYNLYGNVTATTTGVSYNYEYNYEVTATDTELTPKVVKVDEIDANANRLVMLENVVFQNVAENQAFSKTQGEDLFGGTVMVATAYDVKVGEAEAKVEPFASSNVYGNNIPTQAVDVVGVAALNSTVMPRSMADFTDAVAPAEPKAEVTLESSVDKIAINEKTLVATYKVEVENLTADGTVTFTGDNADMFVAEPATITNETTEVKVYATATAAGEYAAKVVFNFGIEALNKEFDLAVEAAAAVTPEVPTVTLSNAVVKLSAIEGQEATDKVTLTMANCTAPVVITAKNEVNEITLSTMSIEPSAEPVEITITFAPTKEGVFKQQFEITTEGMETPVVLEVEGTGISYIAMLAADADGIYRVYNVNGVKLMETSNAQDLNNLAAGLYIINGRKYMIRK